MSEKKKLSESRVKLNNCIEKHAPLIFPRVRDLSDYQLCKLMSEIAPEILELDDFSAVLEKLRVRVKDLLADISKEDLREMFSLVRQISKSL